MIRYNREHLSSKIITHLGPRKKGEFVRYSRDRYDRDRLYLEARYARMTSRGRAKRKLF
jgi:hypothetical protein